MNTKEKYTTREIERKTNMNTLIFGISMNLIILFFLIVFFYDSVPHCYYEKKEVKIIIPKWDKWTDGQEIQGEKIYCDDWLNVYEHKDSFLVANFDMNKDGLCIVRQVNKICE